MNYTALLIDRRPGYLEAADETVSVLTLPLGASTVLETIAPRLIEVTGSDILVLPAFPASSAYIERIQSLRSVSARVVTADELSAKLQNCETSDYLIAVEASHWPRQGHGFVESIRQNADYHGATHLIAVGSNLEGARESVECDQQGYVTRVQRLYNSMSWPDVVDEAICYSFAPSRAIYDIPFQSLGQLRTALVTRGVLSHDVPLTSDIDDLCREDDLLALNQRVVSALAQWPVAPGLTERSPGVVLGRDCLVHPTAKLIAPIIIRDDVQIEANATIIGPAIIGTGVHVGHDAVVAQSIICDDAGVPPGATARQRLILHGLDEHATRPHMHRDKPFAGLFQSIQEHCERCENRNVTGGASAGCTGCLTSGIQDEHHAQTPFTPRPLVPGQRRRIVHLAIKRSVDFLVAALALLALSPLLILMAIVIKLDSRGPVFFSHRREGKGGKEFPCIKFRTMISEAHQMQRKLYENNEVDGPQFKLRHDPRVTRAGRWLRATNIDELPQLINVLLGHMSLVGPRPSPFRENQICVPWRRARLSMRPGITGLWQVCRSEDRSAGDFHEWIFYDMAYVRSFSAWLDLKILIATVLTLGGKWSLDPGWILPIASRGSVSASPVTASR